MKIKQAFLFVFQHFLSFIIQVLCVIIKLCTTQLTLPFHQLLPTLPHSPCYVCMSLLVALFLLTLFAAWQFSNFLFLVWTPLHLVLIVISMVKLAAGLVACTNSACYLVYSNVVMTVIILWQYFLDCLVGHHQVLISWDTGNGSGEVTSLCRKLAFFVKWCKFTMSSVYYDEVNHQVTQK